MDLEKIEKEIYQQEKEDFLLDKCTHCMGYLNDNGLCENNFCEAKIPEDYR